MKNVLKSILSDMTQYKNLEFVIIKNNEDGHTIATGINTERRMLITANAGSYSEIDTMLSMGNLPFLKKILDQEQMSGDTGKMELVAGTSQLGSDIYKHILFKSPRMNIKYSAVDPRAVQEKARNTKFPPVINDLPISIKLNIEEHTVDDFKQAAALQRMMSPAEESLMHVNVDDKSNLIFGFPYTNNSIDVIVANNIESSDVPTDLKFDVEMLEKAFRLLSNRSNRKILLSSKFMDIKYTSYLISYHVRFPIKTIVKRM